LIKQQDIELGHLVTRQLQLLPALNDEIGTLDANLSYVPSPEGTGPYLPIWQMSPFLPMKSLLTFDILWNPINSGVYREVLRTGNVVVDSST
jgi:hypothetical protein